ncbi:hypothetical protein GUJ93_ZPchr0006g45009 [Zizania palustris]|uniref:Uncharacterized protein n=1 Tax=Zizania palustris TaxID=103762 RepID=A0A8J5T1C1_ZIZPA|nr:hypothetical protein GUJ93_ZPchr0006g45009 [Zizania palustris]
MEEQLKRTAMMKKIAVPEKKPLRAAASGKTRFTASPEAPAVMVSTPTKAAAAHAQSKQLPGSPRAAACLCSPTTHAGSFRCRLHRGGGGGGLSNSVGYGLNDIGKKPGV